MQKLNEILVFFSQKHVQLTCNYSKSEINNEMHWHRDKWGEKERWAHGEGLKLSFNNVNAKHQFMLWGKKEKHSPGTLSISRTRAISSRGWAENRERYGKWRTRSPPCRAGQRCRGRGACWTETSLRLKGAHVTFSVRSDWRGAHAILWSANHPSRDSNYRVKL